jgi:hypothetical protein
MLSCRRLSDSRPVHHDHRWQRIATSIIRRSLASVPASRNTREFRNGVVAGARQRVQLGFVPPDESFVGATWRSSTPSSTLVVSTRWHVLFHRVKPA